MKRRVLSSVLAAALLAQTAGAAFIDIEDSYTQQAASSLAGLGIVSGTGFGQFEPDRLLTRAEFTRLAVGAMGITNVDNYRSYTIFPDVPAGHWASGWVNAAVRHPDFAENPIIRGLGDGTFGPGNATTLGEACTIALRMLGYEQADIGPFWPNDYVTKSRSLGLLTNLPVTDPNGTITRGQAAILFRNTLTAQTRDGKSMLSSLSGGDPVEHWILVATGDTDASLTASEATFYEPGGGENGRGELHTKKLVGQIDPSVVGFQGVIIFDKSRPDHVRGFLPDQSISREIVAQRVEPDGILTEEFGFIKVPRHTPLVALGAVHDYGESWFDLTENTPATLHYDTNGVLQMVSASAAHYSYPIIIVGINGSAKDIPARWRIEKNGQEIRENGIEKYDVITLDIDNKTALVCSNRLTGIYENAKPSFRYPESITIAGAEFAVPDQFATSFKSLQAGERITLIFDPYGRVCGAVNDPRAEVTMEGVVVACTETSVSVRLFNGITVSGEPATRTILDENGEEIELTGLDEEAVGQQVTVRQKSDGTLDVQRLRSVDGAHKTGNWDIANRTLGSAAVSPHVQVYERVGGASPLSPVSLYDIPMEVVPAAQIISTRSDSTGAIVTIILKDVTGDSWIYGMVKDTTIVTEQEPITDPETGETIEGKTTYDYRVKITTLIDGKSEEKEFLLNNDLGRKLKDQQIVGLPVSALSNQTRVYLSVQIPEKVDTVGVDAFSGYSAVRTGKGYYPIADNVPVYVRRTQKCITLREAKASYVKFELYAEKGVNEGGKIRVIVV